MKKYWCEKIETSGNILSYSRKIENFWENQEDFDVNLGNFLWRFFELFHFLGDFRSWNSFRKKLQAILEFILWGNIEEIARKYKKVSQSFLENQRRQFTDFSGNLILCIRYFQKDVFRVTQILNTEENLKKKLKKITSTEKCLRILWGKNIKKYFLVLFLRILFVVRVKWGFVKHFNNVRVVLSCVEWEWKSLTSFKNIQK